MSQQILTIPIPSSFTSQGYSLPHTLTIHLMRVKGKKRISLSISENNRITLKSPYTTEQKYLENFIQSKMKWIIKKLLFNTTIRIPFHKKLFKNGEVYYFLGKPYILFLQNHSSHAYPDVTLKNKKIILSLRHTRLSQEMAIKNKLLLWYKSQASRVISKRLKMYQKLIPIDHVHFIVKSFSRRWGHCSSRQILAFNWKLIMGPLQIIDYVIVHELCHILHFNHSKTFWRKVSSILPDYKERRKWLTIHENQMKW